MTLDFSIFACGFGSGRIRIRAVSCMRMVANKVSAAPLQLISVHPAPLTLPPKKSPFVPRNLNDAQRAVARTFRPIAIPRLWSSLLATLVFVTCHQCIVALYAANERSGGRPAIRGLVVGLAASFVIGPNSMCGASMTSRGGFHWRFALSVPITIGVALATAFVPVGDATLGFIGFIQ